jgi:uncharacterized protein YkwD
MQIQGFGRATSAGLCMLLVAVAATVRPAQARETYASFAERLATTPPDGVAIRDDLEAAVLRATNAYRTAKRLPTLKPATDTLKIAARAQAVDLLEQGTMGHVSSTGYDFGSRMRALHPGQMFLPVMAENAARLRNSDLTDSEAAQALVAQWIKSPSHRKAMSDRSYVTVAIGVARRGKDIYAVQVFSGPTVKTNMGSGVQ